MGQHRDQPVTAVAFELVDGCTEDLQAQALAQAGNHMLADIVGADVGDDRTEQRHQAQSGKAQQYAPAGAVFGMQGMVDGRQQPGDAQATQNAEHGGDQQQWPERTQHLCQFMQGTSCRFAHRLGFQA
ncbi:hypothetical protein D3C77_448970 [compost metagenome]